MIRTRRWTIWPLCIIACAASLAFMLPSKADEYNLLTMPGEASRVAAALVDKIGHAPKVFSIDMNANTMQIEVQGARDFHVDQYRWSRWQLKFLHGENISGPTAISPSSPVSDITSGFFEFADVDFTSVPALVAATIKRAALEDPAQITSMRIERGISILPQPAFKDARWTIYVTSTRENAAIFADLSGRIVGADLSGTQRAKTMNALEDDWPLEIATENIAAVLPADLEVWEVELSRLGIAVTATSADDPAMTTAYTWNLNGVARSFIDTPNAQKFISTPTAAPFTLGEIDLSILPELKRRAREAVGMPDGVLKEISAVREVTGLTAPQLHWIIDIRAKNAKPVPLFTLKKDEEFGRVTFDTKGTLITSLLPLSQRPPPEWFVPDTMRATLDLIASTLGPSGKIAEISINDRHANVTAEDPLNPGTMVGFLVDNDGMRRTSSFTDGSPLDPATVFTMDALQAYSAQTIATLSATTIAELKMADGILSRLTFNRGNMWVTPGEGQVMVEVRVENPRGTNGGRITYLPDMTPIDVVTPN